MTSFWSDFLERDFWWGGLVLWKSGHHQEKGWVAGWARPRKPLEVTVFGTWTIHIMRKPCFIWIPFIWSNGSKSARYIVTWDSAWIVGLVASEDALVEASRVSLISSDRISIGSDPLWGKGGMHAYFSPELGDLFKEF